MSDERARQRGARGRVAVPAAGSAAVPAAATPATRPQLETVEGLRQQNLGLSQTIARLDRLLLQREAEEEGITFPDGDRAKWFQGMNDLFNRKDQVVKNIEDVLLDDARTRGLGINMDPITVMMMVGREVESGGDDGSGPGAATTTAAPPALGQTLGSVIRQALFRTRESIIAASATVASVPAASPGQAGPSPGVPSRPRAEDVRTIGALQLQLRDVNEDLRTVRTAQGGIEEENVILRNVYLDLRDDQNEAYVRIEELTGQPWKQDRPGALPGGESFTRTRGAIEQIGRDRAAAEEARRVREAAYAAMTEPERRAFDLRESQARSREGDAAALARTRERAKRAKLAPRSGDSRGEGAQGEPLAQAELRLTTAQARVVELGEELARQHRDCDDEKRRMLDDVERNNRDHEEDKNRLRDQNRRDHERWEAERRDLRRRIASLRAQVDRLSIAARLYEQQTAGLGQATARAPHLEEVHLRLERALQENTELQGQIQRLELRVSLLEGNTSAEDVARYQAMASGVEEMRRLMSCDEVRAELNQSQALLERSLATQQSLGQAMRGLMNYVMSVGAPGSDGALRPPAAALQAIGRMHSDFQEHESRWAGAERGGTSNAMLRRKLRKTITRAASMRVEEIEDLTAENDALRAQLADNNNIVDLQRWRTVNTEIGIIESQMLETGPHPLTPPRDLLRLARLQTERLRMMPCPELRQFAIDLQKEAIPTIHDLPDDYFLRQWNDLYDNVRAWCARYYSFQENCAPVEYDPLVTQAQLLGFYIRDVLIHRDYVPQFLNNLGGALPTGRADVATAIVFRILVEEIFEPIRFMIGLRFTDATQRWKFKKQYKIAFELRDMATNAYQPRFQNKASFIERKRTQSMGGYAFPEIDEGGPPPKKRVKSSLQKFNFIRTFEDDEPNEAGRDNDDDIIMNTSRAKFMRTIFALSTDPTNPHFKEMRNNVSNLIIDTLHPLGLTRIPAVPAIPPLFGSDGILLTAAVPAVPEVHGATWRTNPRLHKASLWDIIKRAYDLAIMMRCQRTNIHPLIHDLPSMMAFDNTHFTIVNYPEATPPVERAHMDAWFTYYSPGPSTVGCVGRPVCEVLPALIRRGDPELGNYAWRDRVVISKSKVYVGGQDSLAHFQQEPRDNTLYTVAHYPFATDPSLEAGDGGGAAGGGAAGRGAAGRGAAGGGAAGRRAAGGGAAGGGAVGRSAAGGGTAGGGAAGGSGDWS